MNKSVSYYNFQSLLIKCPNTSQTPWKMSTNLNTAKPHLHQPPNISSQKTNSTIVLPIKNRAPKQKSLQFSQFRSTYIQRERHRAMDTNGFQSISAKISIPFAAGGWSASSRDGAGGSSRDEIYGCSQFRANGRSSMEVLFQARFIGTPHRRAFVFAYRAATSPGATRKYDGRMRRWDLSGVRTNERPRTVPWPKISTARFRGMNEREESVEGLPARIDITCANKRVSWKKLEGLRVIWESLYPRTSQL